MKFDLNVSITLPQIPFLQRFDAARDLGFEAVEFWWPGDQDLTAVERAVSRSGLQVALINLDGGDLSKGERGLMNSPAYAERFRQNVPIAVEFASALGCGRINALAGNLVPGEPVESQLERISRNLAWAAGLADGARNNASPGGAELDRYSAVSIDDDGAGREAGGSVRRAERETAVRRVSHVAHGRGPDNMHSRILPEDRTYSGS